MYRFIPSSSVQINNPVPADAQTTIRALAQMSILRSILVNPHGSWNSARSQKSLPVTGRTGSTPAQRNCTRFSGESVAASKPQRLARFWLRYFSSGPHLVGSTATLFWVTVTALGVVETYLHQSLIPWWWLWWLIVLVTYAIGWLLTGFRLRSRSRSWAEICFPQLDDSAQKRLALRRLNALNHSWTGVPILSLALELLATILRVLRPGVNLPPWLTGEFKWVPLSRKNWSPADWENLYAGLNRVRDLLYCLLTRWPNAIRNETVMKVLDSELVDLIDDCRQNAGFNPTWLNTIDQMTESLHYVAVVNNVDRCKLLPYQK